MHLDRSKNTNHWIVGCDGGVYETFTHAKEWKYYANLPIIQFYKVTTDNATPFYNIFGGTQDNNSMGGPSATNNAAGILNSDWYITNGEMDLNQQQIGQIIISFTRRLNTVG